MEKQPFLIDENTEEYIQKSRIRTQKIIAPLIIGFAGLDSNKIDKRNKIITLSPFWAQKINIQTLSPEDILKPFAQPIILSKILLVLAFISSCLLPVLFLVFNEFEMPTFQSTIYFFVYFSLIQLIVFTIGFFFLLEKHKHERKKILINYAKRLNKKELYKTFIDSVFYFFYLFFLLKNCYYGENIIIANTHVLILLFRFCISYARKISINTLIIKSLMTQTVFIFITIIVLSTTKEHAYFSSGLQSILAALSGGMFWLRNKEINSTIFLKLKYFIILIFIFAMSFAISLFIYGLEDFITLFFEHFFDIFSFSILFFVSQYLLLQLAFLFEEIIFQILFCFQGFCIYVVRYIVKRLFYVDYQSNWQLFEDLVLFLLIKSILVMFFLVLNQLLILIELKKSETNLEGGKLGFGIHQRDSMKLHHFEMLEKLNLNDTVQSTKKLINEDLYPKVLHTFNNQMIKNYD